MDSMGETGAVAGVDAGSGVFTELRREGEWVEFAVRTG
jgi:hypothetical protein